LSILLYYNKEESRFWRLKKDKINLKKVLQFKNLYVILFRRDKMR